MNSYCRRRLHSFFLLLFAILVAGTGSYAGVHAVKCLPDQEASLLDLKQGFRSIAELSELLVSWKPGSNCCSWEGVTCDTASGHVIGLHLSDMDISGNLSCSLFNLTSLQTLNLAGNYFEGAPIPQSGFERLTKLTHLNLNYTGLSGQIPIGISRLTSLISLDLSGGYELQLRNPNLQMLVKNLSNLRELHLDHVSMSSEHDWSKTLSKSLPRLQVLSLVDCDLPGSLPKDFFSTNKNLTDLDLSFNPRLPGALPDFPTDNALKRLSLSGFNMSSEHDWSKTLSKSLPRLQVLSLFDCDLPGSLPNDFFSTYKKLTHLDLSENRRLSGVLPDFPTDNALQRLFLRYSNFSGPIPASIANLTQLVSMDLSSNHLSGPVPSFEPQAKLSYLVLYNNSLTGPLPMSLFCLPHLKTLDLSHNQLSGELGEFLNPSTSLQYIDLRNNQLQGWIPRSISKMPGLESFYIASNNFSVELDMFNSLKNLTRLSVSNNKLIQDVSENNFHTFPKLYAIDLASCNFSKIPAFLRYQDRLEFLDISNNRINGSIPKWIWRTLLLLNLSFNSFSNIKGPIDLTTTNLLSLSLQSNMLQGPIPLPPLGIGALDYSNNNFSSTIPSNIFFNLNYIEFFSLANNIISGEIPPSICTAKTLQVLDFSNNSLSGSIPSCLLEGNNSLVELNLRGNQLREIIPQNISKGCKLERIMFDGNSLQGKLPRSLINCISLEVLDLGNNHIMDFFPYWLTDLVTLRVLILRANKFYGPINCVRSPGINYALPELQIFDLSSNHFNGSLSPECFNALKAMLNSSQLDSSTMGFNLEILLNFSPIKFIYDVVSVTNKGEKSTMRKLLTIFTYVDLSNNAFEGDIPEVIGELQGLHVLNLSHNFLSGDIPPTIGNMKQIESLDLSANSLSGEIPNEMVSLTFLSYLNLSDNNFIGKIPQGNQFSTFSNASFQENPGLCGSPLSKQCGNASPKITDAVSPSESDSSSSTYVIGLALFVGLGFGVGFAVILVLQNVPLKFWRKE